MKNNTFARYMALFASVMVLGLGLLYFAGLFPQEKIHQNIVLSTAQFEAEGEYPNIFNLWNDAYKLDAFSEALIINHSYFMDTAQNPLSIIENRAFRNSGHTISCLSEMAENPGVPGNTERARYWLGFRAYVRPLLSIMPYQDIRGVLSLVFFILLFAAFMATKDSCGTTIAFCFMIAMMSMNLVIVSTSLQYSCCFLIAFSGVWILCRVKKMQENPVGLFMVLGQATMFFDFYTSPLVTWGMPFILLLAIKRNEKMQGLRSSLRLLGITLFMWIIGYVGMWLVKMVLNTLFAGQNGFAVFKSFLYYTGITKTPENLPEFTAVGSLISCMKKVLTVQNRFALCIAVPVFLVCKLRKKNVLKFSDSGLWGYVAAALVPAVWILCSRQASGGHAYFQYRSLAVSVLGVLCFVTQLWEQKKMLD